MRRFRVALVALGVGLLGSAVWAYNLRSACLHNLYTIARALKQYHAIHGTYPTGIRDQNGLPQWSWRVQLFRQNDRFFPKKRPIITAVVKGRMSEQGEPSTWLL